MSDDIGSWELRIDYCLGQASRVLDHATDAVLAAPNTEEVIAGCITLAEAWRALAESWEDRQAQEVALIEADEELAEVTQ